MWPWNESSVTACANAERLGVQAGSGKCGDCLYQGTSSCRLDVPHLPHPRHQAPGHGYRPHCGTSSCERDVPHPTHTRIIQQPSLEHAAECSVEGSHLCSSIRVPRLALDCRFDLARLVLPCAWHPGSSEHYMDHLLQHRLSSALRCLRKGLRQAPIVVLYLCRRSFGAAVLKLRAGLVQNAVALLLLPR